MFHHRYADATQIRRRKSDQKKIENKNDITDLHLSDVAGEKPSLNSSRHMDRIAFEVGQGYHF